MYEFLKMSIIFFIFFFTAPISITFAGPTEKQPDDVQVSSNPFMDFLKASWRLVKKPFEYIYTKLFSDKAEPVGEAKVNNTEKSEPVQKITEESPPSVTKLPIQLLFPDGDKVGSGGIIFEWSLGGFAGRAEKVEVRGSNKIGGKLYCLRNCKKGDDCERCELKDLVPARYEWYVDVIITGDGSKHQSDKARFSVLPHGVITDLKLRLTFPKPGKDVFQSGTEIPFRWRLGKLAVEGKAKTVAFRLGKEGSDNWFHVVVLECKKVDCRQYRIAVWGYGPHEWMVEATGHDGLKLESNMGHFTLEP